MTASVTPLREGVLGDIADVLMGQSPVGSSYNRARIGTPLINGPTEFTDRHPIPKQWTTAPVRFCKAGDVLICVRGSSTGRINIADQAYCIGRGVAAVRAKRGSEQTFVTYALAAVVSELLKLQTGSTFPSIDSRVITSGPLLVPSPQEREHIGETLLDVDDLIATLERLVAKKQVIKQGMMQQLLTGRTRLPGFTDDWRQSTVGAEFDVRLGKMLHAAKNEGVAKPYLGNRAVQWGHVDVSAAGSVPMTRSDIQRYRLQAGDLLVCEGGEVGRAAVWRNELSECYFQKALHRLRPKNGYDIRVMQALLELWSSVGYFVDYVTQTSIAHLPREKFVEMPLPLPSIAEQTATGDLIEDLDREIACIHQRIVKHRAIKQGMMRQLLTGRTRLFGESAS